MTRLTTEVHALGAHIRLVTLILLSSRLDVILALGQKEEAMQK